MAPYTELLTPYMAPYTEGKIRRLRTRRNFSTTDVVFMPSYLIKQGIYVVILLLIVVVN